MERNGAQKRDFKLQRCMDADSRLLLSQIRNCEDEELALELQEQEAFDYLLSKQEEEVQSQESEDEEEHVPVAGSSTDHLYSSVSGPDCFLTMDTPNGFCSN